MKKFGYTASLCIAFIIITACGVIAIGKTTVDPNIQPNDSTNEAGKLQKTDLLDQDKRLDIKITYEAGHKMVSTIIDDLANLSDVQLRTGYNNNDWQVRDRRMNIYAEEVPLREIMKSIARVMHFKWERLGEKDVWRYRLYMDRQSVLLGERLENEHRKKIAKIRQETLDKLSKVNNLSADALEDLKKDSPMLYIYQISGLTQSIALIAAEHPGVKDNYIAGEPFKIKDADLSPKTAESIVNALCKFEETFKHLNPPKLAKTDFPSPTVQFTLEFRPKIKRKNIDVTYIALNYEGGQVGAFLLNPDSSYAKFPARIALACIDEKRAPDEAMVSRLFTEEEIKSHKAELDGHNTTAEDIDSNDPSLSMELKIDVGDDTSTQNILKMLAKASKLAVITDSYESRETYNSNFKSEGTLGDIIQSISIPGNYDWKKRPLAIEFWDREWFEKRKLQVPEAWLEKWRASLKKNNTLNIDELAEIAKLTHEQYLYNFIRCSSDDILRLVDMSDSPRKWLRFYNSLNTDQKKLVLTKGGLEIAGLSEAQWSGLEQVLGESKSEEMRSIQGMRIAISQMTCNSSNCSGHDYIINETVSGLEESGFIGCIRVPKHRRCMQETDNAPEDIEE